MPQRREMGPGSPLRSGRGDGKVSPPSVPINDRWYDTSGTGLRLTSKCGPARPPLLILSSRPALDTRLAPLLGMKEAADPERNPYRSISVSGLPASSALVQARQRSRER